MLQFFYFFMLTPLVVASLDTTHESLISCVQLVGPGEFSTSGTDGKLVKWKMDTLSVDMAACGL